MNEELCKNIKEAQEKAKEEYQKAMDQINESRKKAQGFISSNPEKSVLISFGAGALAALILGMILRKR